jgi:murein DD-endopeptidase MepM/ murein hydrolase activator NlpD
MTNCLTMTLPTRGFTARLVYANGLDPDDFRGWVFWRGMLFSAPNKWWGDLGPRDFPHEGIDFCLYRNRSGEVRRLGPASLIPAMFSGRVRALFTDYLGQAVVVEHENPPGSGKGIAVYAHTKPRDDLRPGVLVEAGEIIAAIADTGRSKAGIFPHLHLSLARPAPDLAYDNFFWNRMRDPGQMSLLNPQSLIDGPCEVLDPRKQAPLA